MLKIQSLRAEQSRAEQSRAEQSRAEQSRAEQLNCRKIGLLDNKGYEETQRVYDVEYLSPTIKIGGDPLKIMEVKEVDKINVLGNYMPSEHDASRVVDSKGIAPAVKENHGTVTGVVETKTIKIRQATKDGFIECELPGVADLNYPSSTTRRGRVIEGGQVSPTLTTENTPSVIELGNPDFYNFLYEIDGKLYLIRIRKLIPLECFRLMGVSDEDANKILETNSNTQAYKQAGNSIVVDVLCALFSQLNIKGVEKWNDLVNKQTETELENGI